MSLAEATEAPPAEPASEPEEETKAPGRQLRIDGLPVETFKVQITGGITVTEEVLRQWKLGKAVEITVAGVVSSRRDKAETNFGQPTGNATRSVTLHVHDIVLDDDEG